MAHFSRSRRLLFSAAHRADDAHLFLSAESLAVSSAPQLRDGVASNVRRPYPMTINASDLHGAIAAVVTPFDDDEALSTDGLSAILEYVIGGGVSAVMTTGGTGE